MAARHPLIVWRVAVAARHAVSGQTEEARRDLESLAANDFSDVPRNMMWMHHMSRLSDLVIVLGDAGRAVILYDLLLPYRDRCVVIGSIHNNRGPVSRWLGGLASILSRYDEAERHFEHALEMNARIRSTTTHGCWWRATDPGTGRRRRRWPRGRSPPRARWG
jgi:hypothetical protein